MKRRQTLIAYDIQSNKRRRKAWHCLQEWQLDSQYSVFECLLNAQEAEELFLQLTDIIDEETDALMLAWIDRSRPAKALTESAQISFQTAAWYLG